MGKDEIDKVLLVGGSVHIPKVVEVIKKFFGEGVDIEKDAYPDLVVAKGAAVMAGILSGKILGTQISFDQLA